MKTAGVPTKMVSPMSANSSGIFSSKCDDIMHQKSEKDIKKKEGAGEKAQEENKRAIKSPPWKTMKGQGL